MEAAGHAQRTAVRSANLPSERGPDIRLRPRLQEHEALDLWRTHVTDPNALTVLDLFCGAGGMSAGFEAEGFVVSAGIDADARAVETFGANHLSKGICHDLSQIASPDDARALLESHEIPRPHIVVGGPPCQGFSIVGRARIRSLSLDEQRLLLARNELYNNFFSFVEALQPLLFVIENVPAMRSWQGGFYFDDILNKTRALGYEPFENILDASDYGVPQYRRRQFIIGSRIGMFRFPSPRRTAPITLDEAIGDLPAVSAPSLLETLPYVPRRTGPYQQLMRSRVAMEDAGLIRDHVVRPIRDDDRRAFVKLPPGGRYIDLDPEDQRYSVDSFNSSFR